MPRQHPRRVHRNKGTWHDIKPVLIYAARSLSQTGDSAGGLRSGLPSLCVQLPSLHAFNDYTESLRRAIAALPPAVWVRIDILGGRHGFSSKKLCDARNSYP